MALRLTQDDCINVLIDSARWAWPQAVATIFRPRGINALVAHSFADAVRLVRNNRIHLAILDSRSEPRSQDLALLNRPRRELSGLQVLRTVRSYDRLLPCILLAHDIDDRLLAEALALGAFSVVGKPVDLQLLARQIDRLFLKWYQCNVFSSPGPSRPGQGLQSTTKPPMNGQNLS